MLKKGALVVGLAVVAAFSGCGFGGLDEIALPSTGGESHPQNEDGSYGWKDSGYFSGQEGQTLRSQSGGSAGRTDGQAARVRSEQTFQRQERQMSGTRF